MSTFMQDLRYGFRRLRQSPGFALVCVMTLALGIAKGSWLAFYPLSFSSEFIGQSFLRTSRSGRQSTSSTPRWVTSRTPPTTRGA